MEVYEREYYVSKIKAGYTKIGDIKVYPPTPDVEYNANEASMRVILSDNNLLDEAEAREYLISIGRWSQKEESEIPITEKHTDYWREQIYMSYVTFQSVTREKNRLHLRAAEKHLFSLLNKKAELESYTKVGIATYAKNLYIFSNSCYYLDGTPVDWSNHDITNEMSKFYQSIIGAEEIREIARTSPWNSIWGIYKKGGNKLFLNDVLSMEQQNIIQWSSLYDNVYESSECPSEEVINDNDALDGWLITQRKNREKDRNTSAVEKAAGNKGDAYIFAQTKEDAAKVQSLNSPVAMATMKSRLSQVEKHGILKEGDLADVRQRLMMEANRR